MAKTTTMKNVNITMNCLADGATQKLADALLSQAEANEANSMAILKLAGSLKPIDICAVTIDSVE